MDPLCLLFTWCLGLLGGPGPEVGERRPGRQESVAVPSRPEGVKEDLGSRGFQRLPLLVGMDEDRLRLEQLFGEAPGAGFLIRSPSVLAPGIFPWFGQGEGDGFRWSPLAPEVHAVWNSHLPNSSNQGPLWAGRGVSWRLTVGAALRYRGVTLILAPQGIHEENRHFPTFSLPGPVGGATRSPWANPFHFPPGSMDMPLRFGDEPRNRLDSGQSSLTVETGALAFGAAAENLWWGPGIRNALILSAQAPGVPHLFLRTARPLETRLGTVEARWIVGRLEESDFFDPDLSNDHRSLSALAVTFSPAFDPGLSVGLARAVYAPSGGGLIPLGATFDVFRSVGRPNQAPGDTVPAPGPDQLFSLFARWVFPGAGFEAYGEWGRFEQPANLRDLLELPNHSRGYTVGLQYARPLAADRRLRLQAEVTNLEPSTSYRVRPFGEWYASRSVPQGFTHRGQVLGAAIGPSGSSQWLAGDVFGAGWQAGAYAGRIRWENQAQFTFIQEARRSDVSLMAGLRGGGDFGPLRVFVEYVRTARLNYLFQFETESLPDERGVDIVNHTLKVTLSTGPGFSF